jgi:uncharacterized cupin superfamily protein
VNARDAVWGRQEPFGSACIFESPRAWFSQLGFKLSVLQPGQPSAMVHYESQQEAFLVLAGEARLLVEGEERILRAWDFFHCPAGTEHVFVGAGEGPCVILMTGVRTPDGEIHYPVSELAARYGASVETATSDPDEAYTGLGPLEFGPPAGWDSLPWSRGTPGS